eukprot:2697097-Pleurochrysis_carterae.AAC.3
MASLHERGARASPAAQQRPDSPSPESLCLSLQHAALQSRIEGMRVHPPKSAERRETGRVSARAGP